MEETAKQDRTMTEMESASQELSMSLNLVEDSLVTLCKRLAPACRIQIEFADNTVKSAAGNKPATDSHSYLVDSTNRFTNRVNTMNSVLSQLLATLEI